MWKFGSIAVVVIIADQVSKYLAVKYLITGSMKLLPFLQFSLTYNAGAAFGFLGDASGWQNLLFVIIAMVVSFFILFLATRLGANETQVLVGLLLILGGAIGNVIDRLTTGDGAGFFEALGNGYVIDFIDIYYPGLGCFWPFSPADRGCHFPAFNIADSAIFIGAVLLILDTIGWGFRQKHDASDR